MLGYVYASNLEYISSMYAIFKKYQPIIYVGVIISGMVVGQAPEHPVAPATIHVELFPETVVMPGTNVTVTCRVHRATVDVWPNVVLSKAVIAHDATVPREAIANNADLTPFYAKMGRFEISKNNDNTDLIFTLKITGLFESHNLIIGDLYGRALT